MIGCQEADAVSRVLVQDGYLGMGAEVQRFEEEVADFLGVPAHSVTAVSSGTAALHLAVEASLDPGAEVLVQSLTYVATYQAISGAGAIPVPCEVSPGTVTIDLADAKRRLTPRTRAIMPVHFASNPGDLDSIYRFASQHKLRVIEDAAHAFGCRHNGMMIGSLGDITCFSFDGVKNITTGEGGAIVTADPEVLMRVKDARLLGVEKDTENRFRGQRSWEFDVTRQGWRYHMSNVLAAIGRVQLSRFHKDFAPARVRLARRYRENLADLKGIQLFETDLREVVPHIQPLRIADGRRDEIRAVLGAAGVQTGIHYKPNHLLSYYGGGLTSLPVTELLYTELLSLPLHPGLTEAEVDSICSLVRNVLVPQIK